MRILSMKKILSAVLALAFTFVFGATFAADTAPAANGAPEKKEETKKVEKKKVVKKKKAEKKAEEKKMEEKKEGAK
jgi:Ni/Co efflux regulator RcnB